MKESKFEKCFSLNAVTGSKVAAAIAAVALALVFTALWLVFCVAPGEQVMGAVQRIFYFHVGSAIACYGAIGLAFLGAVLFLVYRRPVWDLVGEASLSVAFLFCTIVLLSGMIWGHSAWNTWWRWEPRLVSFLVLWLILFAGVMLRGSTASDDRRGVIGAVFGIVSAVNVPIVIFSIKLLARSEQLHPQVVGNQGLADSRYVWALIVSIFAMSAVALWLFIAKLGNLLLREELSSRIRSAKMF